MIKYRLGCRNRHEFESWFASSAAFEDQARRRLISCPTCESSEIDRLPMAPAVIRNSRVDRPADQTKLSAATSVTEAIDQIRHFKRRLMDISEHVGASFAEEARKIHFGEAKERPIYGEATFEEARALSDDGIPFGIMPTLPEEQN